MHAWGTILTFCFSGSTCELLPRCLQEIEPVILTDCNRRTYTTKLVKSGKPDKKLDRKKPVLVERRIINHKGQHTHTEVDVKSRTLCDILIELNKDVEGLSLLKEPPFVSHSISRRMHMPLARTSIIIASREGSSLQHCHFAIFATIWHQALVVHQGRPFNQYLLSISRCYYPLPPPFAYRRDFVLYLPFADI